MRGRTMSFILVHQGVGVAEVWLNRPWNQVNLKPLAQDGLRASSDGTTRCVRSGNDDCLQTGSDRRRPVVHLRTRGYWIGIYELETHGYHMVSGNGERCEL